MARPARIGRENGLYHVTSRGNARSDIFRRDGDRERFLDRLGDNLETFEVILDGGVRPAVMPYSKPDRNESH